MRTDLGVSRETLDRLGWFVELLREGSKHQNLIARSTMDVLWDRQIRDSAQLFLLADPESHHRRWIDLGSGPGLPGIVLALIGAMDITLVETRTKRVAFLKTAVAELGLLSQVSIEGRRLERVDTAPFDVITARAFTGLSNLFRLAQRFSHRETQWILPKGRSAVEELEEARRTWQGDFALTPSLTSDQAFIITARNVRPRRRL